MQFTNATTHTEIHALTTIVLYKYLPSSHFGLEPGNTRSTSPTTSFGNSVSVSALSLSEVGLIATTLGGCKEWSAFVMKCSGSWLSLVHDWRYTYEYFVRRDISSYLPPQHLFSSVTYVPIQFSIFCYICRDRMTEIILTLACGTRVAGTEYFDQVSSSLWTCPALVV